MSILLIETPTHGRVIVRQSTAASKAGLLVGFHGYAETAEIQIERLAALPGADAWTLLSVQALHCFYRGRSEEVVSSWMTRQDRDAAIADNVRYSRCGDRRGSGKRLERSDRLCRLLAGCGDGVPFSGSRPVALRRCDSSRW